VPDVTTKSIQDAQKKLTDAGFKIGYVHHQDDQSKPAGTVLSTDPAGNTSAHKGDTINLVESNGMVQVPDVTTKSIQDAQTTLTALGLTVQPQADSSCPVQAGTPVSKQSIVGDQPQGATVTIYYCLGDG